MKHAGRWFGFAAAMLLVGCGGSGSGVPSGLQIRAVNAIPGLIGANVSVGASVIMQNGSYASYTPYESATYGSNIPLLLTTSTGTTLAQATENLSNNAIYTLYACGAMASPTLYLAQETESLPSGGNVLIEVLDLSTTAGGVDVYVTAPGAALTTPTFTNLAFEGASSTTLPAAQYQITFTKTGKTTVIASYTSGALSGSTIPRFLLLDPATTGQPYTVTAMYDMG